MPQSDIDTIILRFRDGLGTADTISQHQKFCDEFGYVWWAWWSKPAEQVPTEVFRHLLQTAEQSGLDVYLLDSGTKNLYLAHCVAISWENNSSKKSSPDGEKTPEYYRTHNYLCWFKFTSIRPLQDVNLDLQKHSYIDIPEFFVDTSRNYERFNNKRIFSADELIHQNRTIWFVRNYRSNDPTHEISIMSGSFIEPNHFPKNFIYTESTTILWLSDLHFSTGDHHAYPLATKSGSPASQPLETQLVSALESLHVDDTAAILVSGDLTFHGLASEYNDAKAFLEQLARLRDVKDYQILTCPGNHDIEYHEARKSDGTSQEQVSTDDTLSTDVPTVESVEISVAPEKAKAAYASFYEQLFHLHPNKWLSCGRRFLLGGAVPIEIVSLNSQLLDQFQGIFTGQGFLGSEQLEQAAKEMNWKKDEDSTANRARPFRIVMVHHHIVPVTYREVPKSGVQYSVMLDAEALMRWATDYGVRLIVHGHMHQPFWTELRRPASIKKSSVRSIYVVGMGSTGIKQSHLGEIGQNTFGLLDFGTKNVVRVSVYPIHPTNPTNLDDKITEFDIPM